MKAQLSSHVYRALDNGHLHLGRERKEGYLRGTRGAVLSKKPLRFTKSCSDNPQLDAAAEAKLHLHSFSTDLLSISHCHYKTAPTPPPTD